MRHTPGATHKRIGGALSTELDVASPVRFQRASRRPEQETVQILIRADTGYSFKWKRHTNTVPSSRRCSPQWQPFGRRKQPQRAAPTELVERPVTLGITPARAARQWPKRTHSRDGRSAGSPRPAIERSPITNVARTALLVRQLIPRFVFGWGRFNLIRLPDPTRSRPRRCGCARRAWRECGRHGFRPCAR